MSQLNLKTSNTKSKVRKTSEAALVILPFFVLLFQLLPMSIMQEEGHSSFQSVTTILFIMSAILFYPATLLAKALGFAVFSTGHWIAGTAVAAVYSFVIFKLLAKFQK